MHVIEITNSRESWREWYDSGLECERQILDHKRRGRRVRLLRVGHEHLFHPGEKSWVGGPIFEPDNWDECCPEEDVPGTYLPMPYGPLEVPGPSPRRKPQPRAR